MSITFTIDNTIGFDITTSPITFTISGVQVNSGQLVPSVTGNALKYLRANAAATALEYVSVPAGTGDVIAPATNTDSYIPQWDGADSKTLKNGIPTSTFAAALGVDDNYVTDAEKTKLSNLSGTNTGDQDLSGYSLTSHNHTGTYEPVIGFTPENVANKKLDLTDNSDTYYPSQKAVKTAVDAKLTNSFNTAKLLGRSTAGVGVAEEITLGTNLSFSGTTLNAGSGGSVNWGGIGGTLSDQTDVSNAINAKLSNSTANANSVLCAITDDTPIAMTIDTNTVFGRIAGNIQTIAIDNDLSTVSASDDTLPSAKAVKALADLKANLTSPTFATSITGSYLTASEMLGTDGSKNIVSLPVATYPSLTELSYVKGLSSAVQTQLTARVEKATYNANTVLAAVSDDTPAAVYINEQEIFGRVTGGNIGTLAIDSDISAVSANHDTVPSAKAVKDYVDTRTNNSAILTSDGTYTGDARTVTVDTNTVGVGAALTFTASDSHYDLANATDTTKLCHAIAVESSTGSKKVITKGQVCVTSWNWTVGGLIYLAATDGTLTQTAPATTGNAIQILGRALSADTVDFNIDNNWLTRA